MLPMECRVFAPCCRPISAATIAPIAGARALATYEQENDRWPMTMATSRPGGW